MTPTLPACNPFSIRRGHIRTFTTCISTLHVHYKIVSRNTAFALERPSRTARPNLHTQHPRHASNQAAHACARGRPVSYAAGNHRRAPRDAAGASPRNALRYPHPPKHVRTRRCPPSRSRALDARSARPARMGECRSVLRPKMHAGRGGRGCIVCRRYRTCWGRARTRRLGECSSCRRRLGRRMRARRGTDLQTAAAGCAAVWDSTLR